MARQTQSQIRRKNHNKAKPERGEEKEGESFCCERFETGLHSVEDEFMMNRVRSCAITTDHAGANDLMANRDTDSANDDEGSS